MYQAIHYNKYKNKCSLRDDVKGWVEFEYFPTYYKLDPNGTKQNILGQNVSEVDSYDEKNIRDYFEVDIDNNLRILSDVYLNQENVPSFHNIVFFDIEIEMGGALTPDYIKQAPSKFTSVALFDKNKNRYYCLILDENDSIERIIEKERVVVPFKTEKELLFSFVELWKKLDPTIVIGWNSNYFDIPYMYHRICKILGKSKANELSPLNYIREQDWSEKQPIKIAGISSLDYLLLYKKFIPKTQPSYKLDYIGTKEVGIGKIKYKGNLNTLFKSDVNAFIEYNLRDVEIMVKLDEKKRFIDLTTMVCHIAHTEYENIYYSSIVLDGVIYTHLKRMGIVSLNKPVTNNPELRKSKDEEEEDEKFTGAYVKAPIVGLHDWLCDEDLKSLYPSIIRSLNISYETIIGRFFPIGWELEGLKSSELTKEYLNRDGDVILELVNGKTKQVSSKKLLSYIISKNYNVSGNGVIFDSERTSVLKQVLDDWTSKRDYYKNLMKDARKALDFKLSDFYDIYQSVFKVFNNSIYGCLSLPSFRYTDENKWLSTSTTLSGQAIIKNSIDYINEKLSNEIGVEDDYVVASDTDSMFIKCWEIVKKRFPNLELSDEDDVIIPRVREIAYELSDEINEYYDKIANNFFNISSHFFEIKNEYIIKKAYWSDKKKYACFLVEKEGTPIEKGKEFDFKGLDLMKSNFPPKFKEFSEQIIKDVITSKGKEYIDKKLLDFKQYTKTCPIQEVSLPVGIKELRNKVESKPRIGKIFSKPVKGCSIHIKSAIFYNDLLTFKGLHKEYSIFQEGDSLYYTYLKQNPYNIETIAFNGYDDPPFITEFIEKYADRNENFNSIIVKKFEKLYDNLGWGTPIYNPFVNVLLNRMK